MATFHGDKSEVGIKLWKYYQWLTWSKVSPPGGVYSRQAIPLALAMFFKSSLGRPSAMPKLWNTIRRTWQTEGVGEKYCYERYDGVEWKWLYCLTLSLSSGSKTISASEQWALFFRINSAVCEKETHLGKYPLFLFARFQSFRLTQFDRTGESKKTGSCSPTSFPPPLNQHEEVSLGRTTKRKRAVTPVRLITAGA